MNQISALQFNYQNRSPFWLFLPIAAFVFFGISFLVNPLSSVLPVEQAELAWESVVYLPMCALIIWPLARVAGGLYALGDKIDNRKAQLSSIIGLLMVTMTISMYAGLYLYLQPFYPDWLNDFINAEYDSVDSSYPWWVIVFDFLGLAVLTPIWEEMIFRGLFFFILLRKLGFWPAAIISSVVFGILHADIIGSTIFGLVLCYLTYKLGSLWPAVIVHIVNNAIASVLLYLPLSETLLEFKQPSLLAGCVTIFSVLALIWLTKLMVTEPKGSSPLYESKG